SGAQHQQGFVGGAGHNALCGAPHLLELGHQVRLRAETTCRVHDDVISFAGGCGLQRIEQNPRRVSPRLRPDYLGASALSPYFELLDSCGPESVGSAEQDGLAVAAENLGQLANGGGLARAVDAHDNNNFGYPVDLICGTGTPLI